MDEIHTLKSAQYHRGCFFGIENNQVTKTILAVMVKSVASKHRDVVSLTPIVNINWEKLLTIWHDNLKVLTDIGYNVCITMTDGHDSNVKFFKKISNGKALHEPIENPYKPGSYIYKLFDPTHLFKNFYNNLMNKETFIYPTITFQKSAGENSGSTTIPGNIIPTIEDSFSTAEFSHLVELHALEMGKPLKMAHKLNGKVLNPGSVERTNVQLAEAAFHSSTIAALQYYSEHGHPDFSKTAGYLKMVI